VITSYLLSTCNHKPCSIYEISAVNKCFESNFKHLTEKVKFSLRYGLYLFCMFPDMTYNVFSGTLNPAQSINQSNNMGSVLSLYSDCIFGLTMARISVRTGKIMRKKVLLHILSSSSALTAILLANLVRWSPVSFLPLPVLEEKPWREISGTVSNGLDVTQPIASNHQLHIGIHKIAYMLFVIFLCIYMWNPQPDTLTSGIFTNPLLRKF